MPNIVPSPEKRVLVFSHDLSITYFEGWKMWHTASSPTVKFRCSRNEDSNQQPVRDWDLPCVRAVSRAFRPSQSNSEMTVDQMGSDTLLRDPVLAGTLSPEKLPALTHRNHKMASIALGCQILGVTCYITRRNTLNQGLASMFIKGHIENILGFSSQMESGSLLSFHHCSSEANQR